jgi:hypothetical protein
MRWRETCHVAGEAFRSVVLHWFQRLIVWIMAGSAPKFSLAFAGAGAARKLFYMADDFEFASIRTGRGDVDVGSENIFQGLPRTEVAKLLSRI